MRYGVTGISNCPPLSNFCGKDLYPSPFAMAAAVGESLIINPFMDGNKRTGLAKPAQTALNDA